MKKSFAVLFGALLIASILLGLSAISADAGGCCTQSQLDSGMYTQTHYPPSTSGFSAEALCLEQGYAGTCVNSTPVATPTQRYWHPCHWRYLQYMNK